MKKLLVIFVLLLSVNVCFGQTKKFNYEVGVNYNLADRAKPADKSKGSFGGYIEGRYNFQNIPVDLGLLLDINTFKREYDEDWYSIDMKYRTFNVIAVSDYIFRRGSKIEPFVGLGAGISFGNVGTGIFNDGFKTNPCLMPRLGVRFWKHLNISADYIVSHKEYSQINFRVGFFF